MRLSLRAGASLAAGSLAVHELRYLIGYGDPGAVSGHGYLTIVSPLVAIVLALACGIWLARIGRAVPTAPARGTLTWLGASCSLVGVYVVQETIEALAAGGHPGLLAHGGWTALPIAAAIGALVALLLTGAREVDRAAAAVARPWTPFAGAAPVAPAAIALPGAAPAAPRLRVIARRLAGRAPPISS
jgi:hypothetical protein